MYSDKYLHHKPYRYVQTLFPHSVTLHIFKGQISGIEEILGNKSLFLRVVFIYSQAVSLVLKGNYNKHSYNIADNREAI